MKAELGAVVTGHWFFVGRRWSVTGNWADHWLLIPSPWTVLLWTSAGWVLALGFRRCDGNPPAPLIENLSLHFMRSFRSSRPAPSLVLLALLAPIAAQAHPGHSASSGWEQGMLHPLTGLDHLLAILAVGLWAARSGGNARAVVPLGFLGLMAGGAWVGRSGIALPGMESIVLASVLVLGLGVASARRLPAESPR